MGGQKGRGLKTGSNHRSQDKADSIRLYVFFCVVEESCFFAAAVFFFFFVLSFPPPPLLASHSLRLAPCLMALSFSASTALSRTTP